RRSAPAPQQSDQRLRIREAVCWSRRTIGIQLSDGTRLEGFLEMAGALLAHLRLRYRGVLGCQILLERLELLARLQRLLTGKMASLLALLQTGIEGLHLPALRQPARE